MDQGVFDTHSVDYVTIRYLINGRGHEWDYTLAVDHPDFEYVKDRSSAAQIVADNLCSPVDIVTVISLEWWRKHG